MFQQSPVFCGLLAYYMIGVYTVDKRKVELQRIELYKHYCIFKNYCVYLLLHWGHLRPFLLYQKKIHTLLHVFEKF